MTAADGMVEVHLLDLPVPLAAAGREHFEGLTREFMLIAASSADTTHVPARLVELVGSITAQYADINSEADQRLEDAIDARDTVIEDHVLVVPPAAAPAAKALSDILEEADEYCSQGQHLLTLAAPPELVAYRHWYLGEVLSQLAGAAPVPWSYEAPDRG